MRAYNYLTLRIAEQEEEQVLSGKTLFRQVKLHLVARFVPAQPCPLMPYPQPSRNYCRNYASQLSRNYWSQLFALQLSRNYLIESHIIRVS